MTFVVTENCIKCKYTDCVEVCPVDCFHEGPNFLVIDPEECIDCTLCEPECPAEAIYPEDDLPERERIRWHDENRAPTGHRPRRAGVVPVTTTSERVVVREVPVRVREVRYVGRPWYEPSRWYVPLTLGIGYGAWRHHRHRHHGRRRGHHHDWGVRIGWALDPWCW